MQPFLCPQCGHRSEFDPWAGSAHCPRCGFTPPTSGAAGNYVRWAQRQAHQPLLDELLAHWNGTHQPDPNFDLPTAGDALAFFRAYQRALGEDPRPSPGAHVPYMRDYQPTRQQILDFAAAYLWLRRGDRAQAAADLAALVFSAPQFVDAWVWRTATTGDVQQRLAYLDWATRLDVSHPLARDALALAEGRVPEAGGPRQEALVVTQCPQCGAGLRYEPGEARVECPHCGYQLALQATDLVDEPAETVHDLHLKRRYQGYTWAEAQRVLHCHTCGADLTMTHYLARGCLFCGSTNVLVEESQRLLEQPDGILPFQVGRGEALAALERAQARPTQRLSSWLGGGQPALQELQGVYLPFWVFDGMVEAYQRISDVVGTSKQSLGLTAHENLLFPAVDVPPAPLLTSIYPFELGALVPYEPRLLANWPARIYSQDVEMVAEAAGSAMIDLARERTALRPRPPSTGLQRRLGPRSSTPGRVPDSPLLFQMVGTAYQLVLLPVWLARLDREGKQTLGLVNGQAGQVAFDVNPVGD
jgi:predicted RNA-binding Zn-ribbon protein involved in translation (DUF1610 family)